MEGYFAVTDKEELNVIEEALLQYNPEDDDFYSKEQKENTKQILTKLLSRIKELNNG